MTEQIKNSIAGTWQSITPEVRPSAFKNQDGTLKPFYLTREFTYSTNDEFKLDIINYADAYGKIPLVKMFIKGHILWQGKHPIADSAQKVDFIADISYQVMPINPGFVDVLNKLASEGFSKWEQDVKQEILKKSFVPFGLFQGQIFKEYDLIYLYKDLLFWGARNIDGRGFDTLENRPTNLQIPMERKPAN